MTEPILVYVELNGVNEFVGRLWSHIKGQRESATFEYDSEWLRSPRKFALEPALSLSTGPYQTGDGRRIFAAIGDSAPDSWGRFLMRRATRKRVMREGRTPRTLFERDYLLMVNDETRQGALRFTLEPDGPFLADSSSIKIPPLVELPRLLSASDSVVNNEDNEEDLRLLLVPGSSLGGAQPKASVVDNNGGLAIAKFPSKNDEYNRILWEAVAFNLAEDSGITTPKRCIENIAGRSVLILERFDRDGSYRIPYLSGLSMIGAFDNDTRSYLELADAISRYGASPSRDHVELWSRIVFTVLISNVDDHMRNHGFLYNGIQGWLLSPVFDLNPTPSDIKQRALSTTINFDDPTASLVLALEVIEYFGIEFNDAKSIISRIGKVVSKWRSYAEQLNISKSEITRMESAFQHDDIDYALSI